MTPDDPTADLHVVKAHAKQRFGAIDGVQGFGIGDRCVRVYVRTATVGEQLPDTFEGVRLECITVGDITAE